MEEDRESRGADRDGDFYEDAVLFVTGATGFVGKTLVEKLLWSFPQIRRIYILIRDKRGVSVKERFQEFVQHKIFERIREKQPDRLGKLAYVSGNIESDELGLSDSDKELLCSQVSIVFHSAATVRFNECMKVAARVNAIGTWHLLELCKSMQHLKSVVYVSTAYCNPGRKYVNEEIYPTLPPVNWKDFVSCSSKVDDEYFDSLTTYIQSPHPNTYTFTKSIAEQIVNDYKTMLPIVIVRPSIVTAAHQEPYPGWIDNIQGITGIMMEIAKGTISSILCDKDLIVDIIPVDLVVNAMIMMAQRATKDKVHISNCTSGSINPITWERLGELTLKWSRTYPTNRIVMYPNFKYRKNYFFHEVVVVLFHFVPALFMDLVNVLLQKKKKAIFPIARKFRQACLDGKTFSMNEWIFLNRSHLYFEELLSQGCYPSLYWNLESLDYNEYIKNFILGIRKYIHGEKVSLQGNKSRIRRLYWTWIASRLAVFAFSFYVIFKILF